MTRNTRLEQVFFKVTKLHLSLFHSSVNYLYFNTGSIMAHISLVSWIWRLECLCIQMCPPVRWEDVERWRFVTQIVHLSDRSGHAALGHHLLVLSGGALESFPHVDILQGNWEHKKEEQNNVHLPNSWSIWKPTNQQYALRWKNVTAIMTTLSHWAPSSRAHLPPQWSLAV